MSRGGRQYGKAHSPREACHSIAAWGEWQEASLWNDDDIEVSWEFTYEHLIISWHRDGAKYQQKIVLLDMPVHFGGKRLWLRCPGCGRQVAKLYLPTQLYRNGKRIQFFACRHCFDLTYQQRTERDHGYLFDKRAQRIRDKYLEVDGDYLKKRKWQHWQTFSKRVGQYDKLVARANVATVASLGKFVSRH